MNQKRFTAILKCLAQTAKPIRSVDICQKIGISPRTLRNDIKENKDELLLHGAEIISFPAIGYKLKVSDEKKFNVYIKTLMQEDTNHQRIIPVSPEERINYLIRLLLSNDEYIKMDDIAENIFISRSTLTNDLREVRERLKYFQLDIQSSPNYGIKISGSEIHKRSAIAQYYFHTETTDNNILKTTYNSDEKKQIGKILYDILDEEQFYLTDAGFEGLVIHIMIALIRLKNNVGTQPFDADEALKNSREYQIAERICKELENSFECCFPISERCYVAMHLAGKQAAQYQELYQNYQDLIDEVLDKIKNDFKIDLTFDMDLRTALSLHLSPMMNRLKYDMIIQNPLLENIRNDNPTAYDMGVVLAYVIEKEYGFKMSDSEIGYVSLHFALAIERFKKKGSKKNVIIICASGYGSSQILLYKIRSKFKDYIDNIFTTHLYALKDVDQSQYDFILTTVPIPFPTEIPAIHIQYFMDNADEEKISYVLKETMIQNDMNSFFRQDMIFTDILNGSRNDVIHEMCDRIQKTIKLDSSYEKRVIEREDFANTEFGNMIAIPHPMIPCNQDNFVALAILPKPIRWTKGYVKFVFLLSLRDSENTGYEKLHAFLAALCSNKDALKKLEKNPTVETIEQLYGQLSQNEEDLDELFK